MKPNQFAGQNGVVTGGDGRFEVPMVSALLAAGGPARNCAQSIVRVHFGA